VRIVSVCRSAPPVVGGLEAVVGGLSTRLAARGHDVTLVSLVPGETPGVRRVTLPRAGPRRWPFARGLRAACAGADVIHVHGLDGLLDQLLWARPAPIGVSTHGGYFHTPRHGALKALWSRTGTAASLRAADAVWWTSEADRARYPAAARRGTVEPPGVDLAPFLPLDGPREPGRWVVPGRIDVHKGLDDLLAVLPALRDRVHTVEIVGPEARPGLVRRLAAVAAAAGLERVVVFRGALSGPAYVEALARAELVWSPSRAEGFGIAAVEALASGARVVLSDIPAHRPHAGVAALAPMSDPAAAAAVVRRALDAPWDVAAARAAVVPYGWDARVIAFEERYRSLLERA
jgi:alpha-1,3-mannosyltransferase